MLILFLLNPFIGISQGLNKVDHGHDYLALREMSFYDFSDNSNCLTIGQRLEGGSLFESNSTYAHSTFPQQLYAHDVKLGREFVAEVRKMGKEIIGNVEGKLFREFYNCSEKAFNYVQLNLKKYEIISNFYNNVFLLKAQEDGEKRKLEAQIAIAEEDFETKKESILAKIQEDSVLKNLFEEKEKSLQEIIQSLESTVENKGVERDSKIKNLEIKNYKEEREKILTAYRPLISQLKDKKKKEVASATMFWNDKIEIREKELQKRGALEIARLEENLKISTSKETDNQTSRGNRTEIEKRFAREVQEINEEIEELLSS